MLKMNTAKYNDNGTAYAASATLNLLNIGPQENSDIAAVLDYVAVETDENMNSGVSALWDEDPTSTSANFRDLTPGARDPIARQQGTQLVKKEYPGLPERNAQRASVKLDWPQADSNFNCFTIELCSHYQPSL